MKRVKVFLAVILAMSILLMTACTTTAYDTDADPSVPSTDPRSSAKDERVTIGFCMNAMDEFQSEMVAIFRDICERRGIDIIVTNADAKPDKQLADLDSLLVQNPDVIYIVPADPAAMAPGFQAAIDAGIPTLTGVQAEEYANLTFTLALDQYVVGLMVNEWLVGYMAENPSLELQAGYIWGALGWAVLNDRYQGFVDGLLNVYPDRINVLAEQTANWSSTESMALVEDWLQAFPQMNAIISQSDEMSIGAINALKSANVDFSKFYIVSFDGSPNAQTHIREGTLHSTVFYAKKAIGEVIVDYALRIAAGENLRGQSFDVTRLACFVMTKDNID